MLGPLKFRPILKEKVWGGDRLRALAGKDVAPGAKVGETWEVVDRPGEAGVIAEGPLTGQSFRDVLSRHADDVYGPGPGPLRNGLFPLLIKFIDAAQKLSVQVHPDDAYAASRHLDDPGKTECWYVLEPPEEGIVLGVKPGTSPQAFEQLVRSGRVEECLNYERVAAGELLYCPAGTVHAITPPMAMVEIQQNSDTTFRVHDWGRVGLDGKPRELHVERALEVVRLEPRHDLRPRPARVASIPFVRDQLLDSAKFAVDRWTVQHEAKVAARAGQFEILICLQGAGAILTGDGPPTTLSLGDTVLAPACLRDYVLAPESPLALLRVVGKR